MEESKPMFRERVEYDPRRVEQAEGQFEQIAEGRDGVVEQPRPGISAVGDEIIQNAEDRIQDDQREPSPLDHDLFLMPGKQSDQGLDLGKPEEGARDYPDDADLQPINDLIRQRLGIHVAGIILLLRDLERIRRRDSQGDGDCQRRDFL